MYVPDHLLAFIRAHRDELTLSVYTESAPADPAARRNWSIRLRQGLGDVHATLEAAPADEQDAFDRCVAAVLQHLPTGGTPPSTHGWACFATAGGESFATSLPDATETNVSWGPGIRVVPFLLHLTERHALVVRIDREHGIIQRWHDGTLATVDTRDAEHSGTNDDQWTKLEASERLATMIRARVLALVEAHEPVLIGGADASGAHLLVTLPDILKARAIVVPALQMSQDDTAVLPIVHDAVVALDATVRMRRVTELREMAHVRGHAAVGYAPARAAADLGAIAELIFSESAWRKHPDEIEDLVQRALLEGASIVLAPTVGTAPFDGDGEGIIAGLRFPLPALR